MEGDFLLIDSSIDKAFKDKASKKELTNDDFMSLYRAVYRQCQAGNAERVLVRILTEFNKRRECDDATYVYAASVVSMACEYLNLTYLRRFCISADRTTIAFDQGRSSLKLYASQNPSTNVKEMLLDIRDIPPSDVKKDILEKKE